MRKVLRKREKKTNSWKKYIFITNDSSNWALIRSSGNGRLGRRQVRNIQQTFLALKTNQVFVSGKIIGPDKLKCNPSFTYQHNYDSHTPSNEQTSIIYQHKYGLHNP
jgi:hypothetical protein